MLKALRVLLVALVCVMTAWANLVPALPAQAQGGGPNLLVDGDFEAPPVWPWQDGIGEVQVAPGWRAWYLDKAPAYVSKPSNCGDRPDYATDCYWMRPEFRDNIAASFENRVHGGIRSQKYFSYGRMHEAGLYQQVGGIRTGATLRFAISIQAWQCFNIDKCGKNGTISDAPAEMHLRVGIDPYGGTDPFSPNIVWSPEQPAFDVWVEFEVKAVAQRDTVTVFTHSRPEWTWSRQSNDVYLDDASLVAVTPTYTWAPAPVAQPVAPVAPVQPAARRHRYDDYDATTSTPASSASGSGQTYVVVVGDTLFLIAKRFNVDLYALAAANNLSNINQVMIGQTLVIP